MKGILSIAGSEFRFVYQVGVDNMYQVGVNNMTTKRVWWVSVVTNRQAVVTNRQAVGIIFACRDTQPSIPSSILSSYSSQPSTSNVRPPSVMIRAFT